MKYLLFVYTDNQEDSSDVTTEGIARQLASIITSEDVSFVYGPNHAIFNFESDLSQSEVDIFLTFVNDSLTEFTYVLVQNPKNISSDMKSENFDHLLGRKKKGRKTKTTNQIEEVVSKIPIPNNVKEIPTCDLTIDEILDKITEQGVESLTNLEKSKLDNYSREI